MKVVIPAIVMSLSFASCTSVESVNTENNIPPPQNTIIRTQKSTIHTQNASISIQNKKKLTKLCPGISRQKVLAIMGTATAKSNKGIIKNPYRIEKYRSERHVFELLLYWTETNNRSRNITDDELTPLVIMDGKLDGWGWPYWKKVVNLLQKYEAGLKPDIPPKGEKIKNTEKNNRYETISQLLDEWGRVQFPETLQGGQDR